LRDGRIALEVIATPARHGPVGIEPISGDVIGFVLRVGSGAAIYISGDTVWYEQVAEVGRRFKTSIAYAWSACAGLSKEMGAGQPTKRTGPASPFSLRTSF